MIACVAYERGHQRPEQFEGAEACHVETFSVRADCLFDERRCLRAVLRENGQRLSRKPGACKRVEPFCRPREILKHSNREPADVDLNHGRVMYHEGGEVEGATCESASVEGARAGCRG